MAKSNSRANSTTTVYIRRRKRCGGGGSKKVVVWCSAGLTGVCGKFYSSSHLLPYFFVATRRGSGRIISKPRKISPTFSFLYLSPQNDDGVDDNFPRKKTRETRSDKSLSSFHFFFRNPGNGEYFLLFPSFLRHDLQSLSVAFNRTPGEFENLGKGKGKGEGAPWRPPLKTR